MKRSSFAVDSLLSRTREDVIGTHGFLIILLMNGKRPLQPRTPTSLLTYQALKPSWFESHDKLLVQN